MTTIRTDRATESSIARHLRHCSHTQSMTSQYYDALETRAPEQREKELFAALGDHLKHACAHAPYVSRHQLAEIDIKSIRSREDLAQIPVIRKSELAELQKQNPPFAGLDAVTSHSLANIFASPGPIFEFQTTRPDFYRMSRAMYAAGFRAGMRVHNSFGYHFTPAGAMMESGAKQLGCSVIAAGPGQTELQVELIARLRPEAYAGTPSFLKILLDRAAKDGVDVSSLRFGIVSGEALPPSLRNAIGEMNVAVSQCYGVADVGSIAYESPAMEGLVVDEDTILEIVHPGTGDPVDEGDVGEVVVTPLNPDYPLIRFGTGDLSAIMPGESPCGRTNMRIRGWMGRADQTTKVRGMFVHPSQVAQVAKRFPEVLKARLVVSSAGHKDVMELHCETEHPSDSLSDAIASRIREVCRLRGDVMFVEPKSLARDGIVIEDARSYE